MSEMKNRILRQTPSSALGSCRYKLKRDCNEDYEKLIAVMDKFNIEIMFYIGGNDSMDTVDALSQWAKKNNVAKRFVGIPKSVDNDLMVTDHCPGFASAAWILPNYVGLSAEAHEYFKPLIVGESTLVMKDGVPAYVKPYHMK